MASSWFLSQMKNTYTAIVKASMGLRFSAGDFTDDAIRTLILFQPKVFLKNTLATCTSGIIILIIKSIKKGCLTIPDKSLERVGSIVDSLPPFLQ